MPPKLQKFRLTDVDPNVTEDTAYGTTWRDTWSFECPSHMRILLRGKSAGYPGDLFSLKMYDSGGVEYVAPDGLVQIEVRDPSGQKKILVYGPANYLSSDEFQQYTKRAKLRLEQPIEVKPRDKIVFMTKDSTGTDGTYIATSFCRLITSRIVEVEGGRL